MKRLERIQAILIVLQSRTLVRAEDLAERLGVSVRTIYRDLRSLEESGVPIAAEAGVGYSLIKGFTLPPVHLTADEAEHLLLAEKLLAATADESTQQLVSGAMDKIRAVLHSEDRTSVEYLEHRLLVQPTPHGSPVEHNVIPTILRALRTSRRVRITYFSNSTQTTSERLIEPLGLAHCAQHWHVLAWCVGKAGYRDFRADRISAVSLTDSQFVPSRHPLPADLMEQRQFHEQKEPLDVVLDVHESVVPMLTDIRRTYGFLREDPLQHHWQRMYFRSMYPQYFLRYIIGFGATIRVISPQRFREALADYASSVEKHHRDIVVQSS